jgi:hypothetical protein
MPIIDLSTGELTEAKPLDFGVSQEATIEQSSNGVIDLDTGEFVGQQATQAPAEEVSLTDQFLDLFTGELRQTESIKDLPEVVSLDLGNTFDNLKLKASLSITPNAGEKIALIKNNFPEAIISADEKENIVVDFGDGNKGVLDAPGVTLAGAGETFAEIAAFIPAALGVSKFTKARAAKGISTTTVQKAGVGAAGAGLTQTAIEGLQVAAGGTFDESEIAIATALGGVAETVLPAIQAFRQSRRAKTIGAETEEVSKAIESIKPTTQAIEGLEKATGVKVPVFQAQQTQIPSELLKQRILPQLDASARTAAQALETQNKAAFDATTELINTIAPEGTIIGGSKRFLTAAKNALVKAVDFRSESVKPLYKEAFNTAKASGQSVNLNPVNDFIQSQLKGLVDDDPAAIALRSFAKRLKGKEKIIRTKGALGSDGIFKPATKEVINEPLTLQQLQSAKRTADAKIEAMGSGIKLNSAQKNAKRLLVETEKRYMKQVGEVNPQFSAANQEFARLSAPITELEDSVIGQVAKLDDTQLKGIAQKIFDPKAGLTDPASVANAKKVIDSVDPEAWDQLLRVEMNRRIGGLEQLIEDIPGDFVGNIPGQLRRTLFGNPQQRKALMSGMSEEQKQNFKYLETVLKRASSGRAAGSPTAAFGQAIEKLKGISSVIRDVIFRPLSTLQQTGERGIFDRNVANLSRVMFDPSFKPQLKKLKKLNVDSPAAARALTQLLNDADEKVKE